MPDVFVVAGQSNAVGYGKPVDKELDSAVSERIMCWDYRSRDFAPARSPLPHPDGSRYVGVGFAYHFARRYHIETSQDVVLVPCAKGGTGFAEGSWQANSQLRGRCVAWTLEASSLAVNACGGEVKGILWHQAEQDIRDRLPFADYSTLISCLASVLRAEIPNAIDAPFLFGGVSEAWARGGYARAFADKLPSLTQIISNSAFVPAAGLGVMDDNSVHFDAAGQRELADRYFTAYSALASKGSSQSSIANVL